MENIERISRLTELKYMLENHDSIFKKDNIKFNLETWCDGKIGCLTAACALGSAACYAPFEAKGLKLVERPLGMTRLWIIPEYNSETNMLAGADFFGISEDESEYLFDPEQYRTSEDGDDYCPNSFTYMQNPPEIFDKVTAMDVAARVAILLGIYSHNPSRDRVNDAK